MTVTVIFTGSSSNNVNLPSHSAASPVARIYPRGHTHWNPGMALIQLAIPLGKQTSPLPEHSSISNM